MCKRIILSLGLIFQSILLIAQVNSSAKIIGLGQVQSVHGDIGQLGLNPALKTEAAGLGIQLNSSLHVFKNLYQDFSGAIK